MRGVNEVVVKFTTVGTGQLISQVAYRLACAVGVSYGDQYGPIRIEGFTFVDGQDDAVCENIVNPTTTSTLTTSTTTISTTSVTETTRTVTVPTTTSKAPSTTTVWDPERPAECAICNRDTRSNKKLKLSSIMFRYVRNRKGGDRNVQPDGKWGTTFPADYRYPYRARIVLPDKGEIIQVVTGVVFTIAAADGYTLPPELLWTVKSEETESGDGTRQTLGEVWMHASCSHPVRLGDRFGPFEVVGFESMNGEVASPNDIETCIFVPAERQASIVGENVAVDGSSAPLVGVGATLTVSLATLGVAMYYYRAAKRNLEYDGTIESASTASTTQYSPSFRKNS